MGRSTTLVAVPTPAAESAALARLAAGGGWIVPVLDRAGLPQRIERVLTGCGIAVQWAGADGGTDPAADELAPPERPDAVLASRGVDPQVHALAATLCGVAPRELTDFAAACQADGAPRTALVLVDPEASEVEAVVGPLAALAAHGVRFGLLYALDADEARFAVLKTLLVDRLDGSGVASVIHADRDPRIEHGPPMLQDAGSAEGRRRVGAKQDFLLVNGHANALDAALGPELAICARAYEPALAADGAERTFPCFNDGRCFRQPLMGRSVDDHSGLLSVADMPACVLVLSGCNVAALGRAWFDARVGLAYQAQQRDGLACAVTGSVAIGRLEYDLLFLALVAEGRPLGEVVAEVNRVRTRVHHHANAYPAGVGPLFLLGNPCLRVRGIPCQDVAVRQDGRRAAIDLASVDFDPQRGALLRIRAPHADRSPYVLATNVPDGLWCLGICYPSDDGDVLFVWLAPRGEAAIGPGPLELEYSDADPTDAVARAAGTCLRQIPLWTIALDAYLSRWGEHHVRPDPLHAALNALPDAVRGLSRALVTLAPTPGILATARATRTGSRRLWATMTDLSRALLHCLVAGACRFGTLPLAGWEEHLRRLDSFGPVGRCTCGNEVWGQRYSYPDGGPLERHNYQCPVCGPIGEDDGRRLVRLAELPSSVARGDLIDAALECTAPDDEIVQVHAVAVVESLFRDACYVGEPVSVVVAPGAARSVVVRVAAPAELAPGTYPVAILAVVNGASCLIRRFVGVTASRDPRPAAPAAVD